MVVYYKEACKSTSYQWFLSLVAICQVFLVPTSVRTILHVQIHTQSTSIVVTMLTMVCNTACYSIQSRMYSQSSLVQSRQLGELFQVDWPWNDLCKKNAAVLLCIDIRQPKDFLLFLGGKTSNQLHCHEDANLCMLYIQSWKDSQIQRNCKALLFLLQNILKAVQRRSITTVQVDPTELVFFQRTLILKMCCTHDLEMKHRNHELLEIISPAVKQRMIKLCS